MKTLEGITARLLVVCVALLSFASNTHAWEPNTKDLDAAVSSGDFGGYLTNLSAWLRAKMPADAGGISEGAMKALLEDPAFANALGRRQFIARHGAASLGAFAKADQKNRIFLAWLLRNTRALDLYLEAAAPPGVKNRETNTYNIKR